MSVRLMEFLDMDRRIDLTQQVSVIGVGAMGSGIARTLLAAGWCVSVWNRSRDKVDSLVSLGARDCDDPGSALSASECTVVCVADYGVWNRIIEEHPLTMNSSVAARMVCHRP